MTYRELAQIIDSLTEEQQSQDITINCSNEFPSTLCPLDRAVILYGEDRLDDGHFVLEI